MVDLEEHKINHSSYPNNWKIGQNDIIGAEAIHEIIKENSKTQ